MVVYALILQISSSQWASQTFLTLKQPSKLELQGRSHTSQELKGEDSRAVLQKNLTDRLAASLDSDRSLLKDPLVFFTVSLLPY